MMMTIKERIQSAAVIRVSHSHLKHTAKLRAYRLCLGKVIRMLGVSRKSLSFEVDSIETVA